MESLVLYDVTLKFESELLVISLSEDLESFLMLHTGSRSGIGSVYAVSHDVNITATPAIPTDDVIENMRKTIFEEYSKVFSEKDNIEVRCTRFVGITSIKQNKRNDKTKTGGI